MQDSGAAADRRPVLLALRALKLGDLLVAVPALAGLRRRFPDHRIVLAAPGWLGPVVRLVGAIDGHLPTPGLDDPVRLPAGAVDIAVNMHGNGPESRARIDELGARIRIVHRGPGDPDAPRWLDGIHERTRWTRLVTAYGAPADPAEVGIAVPGTPPAVGGAAVLHVGAAYGSRLWPIERFARVGRGLARDGLQVVLTGGPGERDRALAVAGLAGLPSSAVLAGRVGLAETAAEIAAAAVLVSADTGAAHLASAYGTPSAVIFGPAPPEEWGPPPGPHVVLTDAGRRRGEAFAADPDPALLAVGAESVLAAARSVARFRASELRAERIEDPREEP